MRPRFPYQDDTRSQDRSPDAILLPDNIQRHIKQAHALSDDDYEQVKAEQAPKPIETQNPSYGRTEFVPQSTQRNLRQAHALSDDDYEQRKGQTPMTDNPLSPKRLPASAAFGWEDRTTLLRGLEYDAAGALRDAIAKSLTPWARLRRWLRSRLRRRPDVGLFDSAAIVNVVGEDGVDVQVASADDDGLGPPADWSDDD